MTRFHFIAGGAQHGKTTLANACCKWNEDEMGQPMFKWLSNNHFNNNNNKDSRILWYGYTSPLNTQQLVFPQTNKQKRVTSNILTIAKYLKEWTHHDLQLPETKFDAYESVKDTMQVTHPIKTNLFCKTIRQWYIDNAKDKLEEDRYFFVRTALQNENIQQEQEQEQKKEKEKWYHVSDWRYQHEYDFAQTYDDTNEPITSRVFQHNKPLRPLHEHSEHQLDHIDTHFLWVDSPSVEAFQLACLHWPQYSQYKLSCIVTY